MSALLTGLLALAVVGDWPQWRGPQRDGVAAASTDKRDWPEKLRSVWKVSVGEGHSAPVVTGNRVYQFARQGEREVLSAFELESGKKLWSEGYSAPYQMSSAAIEHGKGPKSTPVVAAGKVYTFGISGVLSCVDAASGKMLWRTGASGSPIFGTAMSPILDRGLLIAHVGSNDKGSLTAFDAATGKPKWTWNGDGPAYSSPVIGEFGGVRQVITHSQQNLIGISATDGKLLWKIPFTTPYVQNSVTPLIVGELLLYSGLGNPLTAIRPPNPSTIWENREAGMYMNSPVVANGLVHGMSNRNKGQFFTLDPKTGKMLWTSEGRQAENAAMIARGSLVFALTTNSELFIFRASAKGLEQFRKYTVANSPTWAHPALIGNRILVKDKESLALWSGE